MAGTSSVAVSQYRQIFRIAAFRRFWLSVTLSALGDAMSRVALTWYVYDLTRSPEAVGLLALTYTGPIIVGGLIAGPLLDRFDRRKVMIADNLIRGAGMLLIPLLHGLGLLALWQVYIISSVYGLFVMFSLAGSPALVPDLVEESQLRTANALETISYTLSGVLGPPIAGLLIPLISAPNVALLDAMSYFLFAVALASIRPRIRTAEHAARAGSPYRFSDAVRLLVGNKVLLSTTFMFLLANVGMGAMLVWLPVVVDRVMHGGAELYGLLLGALAVGEVLSSVLVGARQLPLTLGASIALAQMLSGAALALLALSLTVPAALVSLLLLGFFSAPLTIWAQTLRMKIIPEGLRGRSFALLRTLMQSGGPLGGALGGVVLPALAYPVFALVCGLVIGLPGLAGWRVRALRSAD